MEADFHELMVDTISVRPFAGQSGARATPSYGDVVPGIRARVVFVEERVHNAKNEEVVSQAKVWIPPSPLLTNKDLVTLPGRAEEKPIKVVQYPDENDQPHHQVIWV